MELFKASNQWATRPADERFWSVADMRASCHDYYTNAATSRVRTRDLRATAVENELVMEGPTGAQAKLTDFAFRQFASRAGAPAGYLQTLPAEMAAGNLNHGLRNAKENQEAKLLFHQNGGLLCRAATSAQYKRIWNWEVADRLVRLQNDGWQVPPARLATQDDPRAREATAEDCLANNDGGLSVRVGDMIAPAGVYASNHDMFVFMVNEDRVIKDGTDGGLARGFFVWNSEVGDRSLGVTTFLYRAVCGNHIVWGAENVKDLRIRHTGRASADGLLGVRAQLQRYADSSVSDTEARIESARTTEIAATREEVLDAVFSKTAGLTGNVDRAYTLAETAEDNPRSVWGMVQGLTRASQETPHADTRNRIDRAAGKLMEVAF